MDFKSLSEAVSYFTGLQAQCLEAERAAKDLLQRYKAETKAYFGTADGEPMNLIQLAALIEKLSAKPSKKKTA